MEPWLAAFVGVLMACGVYLVLRARTFDVVLGLTLMSYAVNLFIFFTGRLTYGRPPVLDGRAPTLANYADPIPQALVLTAIVIGFAMTALLLVIALRTRAQTQSDHVDSVNELPHGAQRQPDIAQRHPDVAQRRPAAGDAAR